MKAWHLVIDVEKCQDCNNCFLACKDEHVDNTWPGYALPQPRHGHRWVDVMRTERGQFPLIDVAYRTTTCMHCEDAACMKSSTAVYRRPDGIVLIDPNKAKGEKDLVKACPYHMIWWNEAEQVPQKCTFCAHLIDEGWKKPRCVQACPTGALRAEYVEDAEMKRLIGSEKLEVLNPENGTRPHVYYKNLYRFTKCFIAGSVAVRKNGISDCASNATAALFLGPEKMGEVTTDAFGDFKFDRLEKDSGRYTVEIRMEGRETKTIAVDSLPTSLNVGTIYL